VSDNYIKIFKNGKYVYIYRFILGTRTTNGDIGDFIEYKVYVKKKNMESLFVTTEFYIGTLGVYQENLDNRILDTERGRISLQIKLTDNKQYELPVSLLLDYLNHSSEEFHQFVVRLVSEVIEIINKDLLHEQNK
jgi:hypothetical protein